MTSPLSTRRLAMIAVAALVVIAASRGVPHATAVASEPANGHAGRDVVAEVADTSYLVKVRRTRPIDDARGLAVLWSAAILVGTPAATAPSRSGLVAVSSARVAAAESALGVRVRGPPRH